MRGDCTVHQYQEMDLMLTVEIDSEPIMFTSRAEGRKNVMQRI